MELAGPSKPASSCFLFSRNCGNHSPVSPAKSAGRRCALHVEQHVEYDDVGVFYAFTNHLVGHSPMRRASTRQVIQLFHLGSSEQVRNLQPRIALQIITNQFITRYSSSTFEDRNGIMTYLGPILGPSPGKVDARFMGLAGVQYRLIEPLQWNINFHGRSLFSSGAERSVHTCRHTVNLAQQVAIRRNNTNAGLILAALKALLQDGSCFQKHIPFYWSCHCKDITWCSSSQCMSGLRQEKVGAPHDVCAASLKPSD